MKKISFLFILVLLATGIWYDIRSSNRLRQDESLSTEMNDEMQRANKQLQQQNSSVYNSFENKLQDPRTRSQAMIWAPKAMQVKSLSENISHYIAVLRKELNEQHPLILEKNDEANKFYDSLNAYKTKLLETIDPREFADRPLMMEDLRRFKDQFKQELSHSFSIEEPFSTRSAREMDKEAWVLHYFRSGVVSAMSILTKFENEILIDESEIIHFFFIKIQSDVETFSTMDINVGVNSYVLRVGEKLEVYMYFCDLLFYRANLKIAIDGVPQVISPYNSTVYSKIQDRPGPKSINVQMSYYLPDGTLTAVTKTIKYKVLP